MTDFQGCQERPLQDSGLILWVQRSGAAPAAVFPVSGRVGGHDPPHSLPPALTGSLVMMDIYTFNVHLFADWP